MRIGVLATGDTAVRAAHSLAAHPGVGEIVVVGPARSKNFKVVPTASDCDVLVGSGPQAPAKARRLKTPLIWDGESSPEGVAVWGASPAGLTLALAADETDLQVMAVAHPSLPAGSEQQIHFPEPVGSLLVSDLELGGHRLAAASPAGDFAACYVKSAGRTVAVVDDARFMAGVALAAGLAVYNGSAGSVWEEAYAYLLAATDMGLVMGEA